MPLDSSDLGAIWLTFKLASLTTLILLVVGTPIALWLTHTRSWLKGPIGAVVALPLVLPPTVIGFYLLLLMGPHGYVGQLTQSLGFGTLTFSFAGLLAGSVVTETVFSREGVGRLAQAAVSNQDIPMVQGVVLLAAVIFILVNLLVDLLYPLLDPRMRAGAR